MESRAKSPRCVRIVPGLVRIGDVVPVCLAHVLCHPISHQWHVLGILTANPRLVLTCRVSLDWFADPQARAVVEQLQIVARDNDVLNTSRIITVLVDRLADARSDWEAITTRLAKACQVAEEDRLPELLTALGSNSRQSVEGGCA